jgi:ubiquinone/menaquinone biosynthesis C-methylase UbiE
MNRKAYFNEAADTWDERFYTPKLEAFLDRLVPKFGLNSGQNILDVGTGTGLLIPFLLRVIGPSGSITAIDYAEKMVQICKSKYSHIQNVSFKLQDVEELDLAPESFDAITCFGLFPHIENKGKALKNMCCSLKSGGKLIIAHALSSDEIKSHHRNASLAVSHDVLPEDEEIRLLLKRSGFIEIRIKDKPGCYICQSTKL